MKDSAKVTINGAEREIALSLIGMEEVVTSALGLVKDPSIYAVTWKQGSREGYLLPSERMYPEDGMEFTVSQR